MHFNFVSGNTRYVADPDNVGWEFLGVSNDIKTVATTGLEQKKKEIRGGKYIQGFQWMDGFKWDLISGSYCGIRLCCSVLALFLGHRGSWFRTQVAASSFLGLYDLLSFPGRLPSFSRYLTEVLDFILVGFTDSTSKKKKWEITKSGKENVMVRAWAPRRPQKPVWGLFVSKAA